MRAILRVSEKCPRRSNAEIDAKAGQISFDYDTFHGMFLCWEIYCLAGSDLSRAPIVGSEGVRRVPSFLTGATKLYPLRE